MMRLLFILIITCACIHSQAQVNISNITTIAGNDTAGYCCDNGQATHAKLYNPNGICLYRDNLYIADPGNHRIRKIVLSTGMITTVAGTGTGGYNGDNIQATTADLFVPDAVYTDTTGNIYIADALNYKIRKITVSTGIITTVAGNGLAGNIGDGGQATNAKIDGAVGLTIDKSGNIYVSDINNNIIRKVATDGIITTVAGNGTLGYSGDGGQATNAQLYAPACSIVDNIGNIIITDALNNAVRKVDATTGIITTIAGGVTAGYSGDGGLAINAALCNPYGIFIDKHNNIFFAEYCNGTIRKIDGSTGIITTVVGSGVFGFGGDGGPATNAKLKCEDLTIDSNGTMYIADYENNRIRKVYNPKLVTSSVLAERAVKIYPNPAREELTIENAAGNKINIYNLLAQKVLQQELNFEKESINIKLLPPGTYVMQMISANGEIHTKRLVKE